MAFLSLISFALAGCSSSESTGGNTSDPSDEPALRLRSPTEQELKVGDSMTIVYNVANTEQGVSFTSSDEEVVTVSAYGEVEAVGVGEATVTLALVEAPSETASIRYTVTKDFFIDRNGYRNGSVDLTAQETAATFSLRADRHRSLSMSRAIPGTSRCILSTAEQFRAIPRADGESAPSS